MPRPILIIEDEQSIRDALADLFDVAATAVTAVATLDDAKAALAARPYDLILSDIRLGGKRDGGLQVMAAAGLLSPEATVIALTAFPDQDNRLASLRLGATYFLEKPVDLETIASVAAKHGIASSLYPDPPAASVQTNATSA
ncbi:MAG: response regulator [Cytophagaceae bacterium]|nr:response regulator [Gemmatimonadaceae bacterium]